MNGQFPLLTDDEVRGLRIAAGSTRLGDVLAGLFQRTLGGTALAATALQVESDPGLAKITRYLSANSVGGAAAEVMTVTGLSATDTILSVDIKTMGANDVAVEGWTTVAANALTVQFSSDPGAGLVLDVAVKKA